MLNTCKLKHLHEWAIDKPALLASFAQASVTSTAMFLELLAMMRTGQLARALHQNIGSEDWLFLYRQPSSLKASLANIDSENDGHESVLWFITQMTQSDLLPKEALAIIALSTPKVRQQGDQLFAELCKQTYRDTLESIKCLLWPTDKQRPVSDKVMASPAIQFFLLVFIPCLLEFGQTPSRLFASARRGDRQALFDLVRIDKTVVSHPDLKKLLSDPSMQQDELFNQMYGQAIASGVRYDPEPSRIKAQFASLMIQMSESLNSKLNPKEIRHLYDALEKDKTGDSQAIDLDLPEYDEGWRQAISRAKKHWRLDLSRNKKESIVRYAKLPKLPLVSPEDDTGEFTIWDQPAMQPPSPEVAPEVAPEVPSLSEEQKVGFCYRIRNAWQQAKREAALRKSRSKL